MKNKVAPNRNANVICFRPQKRFDIKSLTSRRVCVAESLREGQLQAYDLCLCLHIENVNLSMLHARLTPTPDLLTPNVRPVLKDLAPITETRLKGAYDRGA